MFFNQFYRHNSAKMILRRIGRSAVFQLLLLSLPFFLFWGTGDAWGEGAVRTQLISETEARAAGLSRPWFNQVTMNPLHDRVTHVTLQDDTLFVTSDNGWIHVVDTNTGNTLWSRKVGQAGIYSLPPAANSFAVVVLHGSTAHVYDRFDGKMLLEFEVQGPVGGGPQVGERFIYVPILTGKIFAYPLIRRSMQESSLNTEQGIDAELVVSEKTRQVIEEAKKIASSGEPEKDTLLPFFDTQVQMCPALGHPLVQPFLCTQTPDEDFFSWVTTSGSLMIGNLNMNKTDNALKLLYSVMLAPQAMFIDSQHYKEVSLDFKNDINARPTFIQKDITEKNLANGDAARGGLILMGAQSGYVFAVNDMLGVPDWTFPVGRAVIDPIGVAGNNCFVPTFTGHFYCLDLRNGKHLWTIRDIKQFVSATESHLYALDMLGNLLVLNRDNGQTVHVIPLTTGMRAVFNIESDRIFLVGADGLIQCLHETQFDKVQRYQQSSIELAVEFKERIQNAPAVIKNNAEKNEEEEPKEIDEELSRKMFGDEDVQTDGEELDDDQNAVEDEEQDESEIQRKKSTEESEEDDDTTNPFE